MIKIARSKIYFVYVQLTNFYSWNTRPIRQKTYSRFHSVIKVFPFQRKTQFLFYWVLIFSGNVTSGFKILQIFSILEGNVVHNIFSFGFWTTDFSKNVQPILWNFHDWKIITKFLYLFLFFWFGNVTSGFKILHIFSILEGNVVHNIFSFGFWTADFAKNV